MELTIQVGDEIRPMTAAEQKAYWATLEELRQRETEEAAVAAEKQTKKAAILAALADATGYTADELREALNA